MKIDVKPFLAFAVVMLLGTGMANAALIDGIANTTNNTSVFISLVERNGSNQALRNLLIDTGTLTLDTFAGTPWSTNAAQEAQILAFLGSISAGSSVRFNIGGGLNDQTFATDRYGFLTTGNAAGPDVGDFSALGTGVTNIDTHIGNANQGSFNANGVLAANAATDKGWHEFSWGNSVGGAIAPSNEVVWGAAAPVTGWRFNIDTSEINRLALGTVSSNAATGDISFAATAVPLPGVAWLFAPALGLLTPWVKRRRAAA